MMGDNEGKRGIKRRPRGTHSRRLLRAASESLAPVSDSYLPLIHVTEVGAAREIVESGQIEARDCSIFEKKLAYFFVLRPAYRLKRDDEKSDQINHFPFVFVISPEKLGTPYHIYPFDTGGAATGAFEERADRHVYLEDYELDNGPYGAGRHISWAFGTLAAYFDGELKANLFEGLEPWEDVPRGFINIAKLAAAGANQPDQRASAIEVAYRDHIRLNGNVKLAILPKQYLEHGDARNTEFMRKLKRAKIDWVTYDWQPNSTPDDYRAQIARLAKDYFAKAGTL